MALKPFWNKKYHLGMTGEKVKAALEKAEEADYIHPDVLAKILVNAYFDNDNNIDLNEDHFTEVGWILSASYQRADINYFAVNYPILRLNLDVTQTTTLLTNQHLDLTFLGYSSGVIFGFLFSDLYLLRPNFILNTTVGPIPLSLIAENNYYGIGYDAASNSILDIVARWYPDEGRLTLYGNIVPLS